MRTMAHEIWLDAGNNPSLHVNIVPGQGDTKSPGCSHDNQPYVSNQAIVYSWWFVWMVTHLGCHGYNQYNVTSFINCSELWFHIQCYYIVWPSLCRSYHRGWFVQVVPSHSWSTSNRPSCIPRPDHVCLPARNEKWSAVEFIGASIKMS